MERQRGYNVHHRIGQCNRDWANVQLDSNKVVVEKTKHQALNCLMNTKQSPQEQLEVMVNVRRKGTLSAYANELIDVLLSMPKDEFYDKKFIRK